MERLVGGGKRAFLDSDDLNDLNLLMSHVRDSDVLILFQVRSEWPGWGVWLTVRRDSRGSPNALGGRRVVCWASGAALGRDACHAGSRRLVHSSMTLGLRRQACGLLHPRGFVLSRRPRC